MKLRIGTTEIEITSCSRKRDVQRGFYLDLQIPKDNTTFDELDALLNGCEESIIIIEEDGTETTYNGFSLLNSVMLKNGVYHVEQCCVSEIEAQLSLAQNKIKTQDAIIAGQNAIIAEQNETLNALLGLEG